MRSFRGYRSVWSGLVRGRKISKQFLPCLVRVCDSTEFSEKSLQESLPNNCEKRVFPNLEVNFNEEFLWHPTLQQLCPPIFMGRAEESGQDGSGWVGLGALSIGVGLVGSMVVGFDGRTQQSN